MTRTAWFDGPLPRILAHRGLALVAPQNSLAAFDAALAAGATHVETDVRATADGVAVLVHDARVRVDGRVLRVRDVRAPELTRLIPPIATLEGALRHLPGARFNLDVKSVDAIEPAVRVIRDLGASDRVLVTSFSRARRLSVIRPLGAVATSGASADIAVAVLGARLRVPALTRRALLGLDAVQVPERGGGVDLTAPTVVAAFHRARVEVHHWVVNEPDRMRELVAHGSDGVVTDRADLAAATLR